MSEKAVYTGGDRLKSWFYRQMTTHIVRKVEAFAYTTGKPMFSPDTYDSALRGNKVFVEVIEVLKEFEDHVEENLRQYYVPPEPPLTREEMIEWVKGNMTQTWLYNCLQIAGLPHSTFSNFFNPVKGVSDDVSTKIIEGIHAWYKDLVEKFDYYEARYDRAEERARRRTAIATETRERVIAEVRAEYERAYAAWQDGPGHLDCGSFVWARSSPDNPMPNFDRMLRDRVTAEVDAVMGPYEFLKDTRLPHQMVAL